MKPLIWVGDSREVVGELPDNARRVVGFQLWRVQCGHQPNDWKPMPSIGAGVQEIRIRTEVEHRVIYIAKLPEAVYVLYTFEKRTRRTPRWHLEIARSRLGLLLRQRAPGKERGV